MVGDSGRRRVDMYTVKIRKWVARSKLAEAHYAPDGPGHLAEDLPATRDLLV